jgi:hypothetical protein
MPADWVAIAIAKIRSSTNIKFFLLRFGDAVVQPLSIKRIKAITPRFAFGMLGFFMWERPRREMNLLGDFWSRETLGFALRRQLGKPLLLLRELAFGMFGAVFMLERARREMKPLGDFRRRQTLGFALCLKLGKPPVVLREVVPAVDLRAPQGLFG